MDRPQFSPIGEAERLWFRIAAEDADQIRRMAKRHRLATGTLLRCMAEHCLDGDAAGEFLVSLEKRLRRPYKAQGRRHPRIKRAT